MSVLQARLSQSSPVLEAFGNARTTRNHNSSRFGKFLKLVFVDTSGFKMATSLGPEEASGLNLWAQHARQRARARRPSPAVWSLRGGQVDTYLLEKTRVVGQAAGEGGFHAFYALLAAAAAAAPDPSEWGVGGEPHAYLPGYSAWLQQPQSFEVRADLLLARSHFIFAFLPLFLSFSLVFFFSVLLLFLRRSVACQPARCFSACLPACLLLACLLAGLFRRRLATPLTRCPPHSPPSESPLMTWPPSGGCSQVD
jgi:hypothetical protein